MASEQIRSPDAPACSIQRSAPYRPPRKEQPLRCRCLLSAGCVCVYVYSSSSSSSPVPSPYSPARCSQPPLLPAARGIIHRRGVGSTTPKRAVKPAAALRGLNPFDSTRRALIRPLDPPAGAVEGKVGSSRSVRVGTRVCMRAQPARPRGGTGSSSAEDGSGVPSGATPSSSPAASAQHSLCLGAVLPAGRNQIAGAAGRKADIINPTASIPKERCSTQPCPPPSPPKPSFWHQRDA